MVQRIISMRPLETLNAEHPDAPNRTKTQANTATTVKAGTPEILEIRIQTFYSHET